MKRFNTLLLYGCIIISLLCSAGCSRSEKESEPTKDNSMVIGAQPVTKEKRMFGDLELQPTNDENISNDVYSDASGNKYYYDTNEDKLRMIIFNNNANTGGECSIDKIQNTAKSLMDKVSKVYSYSDVFMDVKEDNGGYNVYCYNEKTPTLYMAVICLDSTGELLTANFNPEAYSITSKYSEDEYILAAKKYLKEKLEDKYESIINDKVEITVKDNMIRGVAYKYISFISYENEYAEGYVVEVKADDMSLFMIDQLK